MQTDKIHGALFGDIRCHCGEQGRSFHQYSQLSPVFFSAKAWASILPETLQGFSEMLYSLSHYFSFPWHSIQVPVRHQFHAHNFLQWLLNLEITRLKGMEDPIPSPVQSELNVRQLSGNLETSLHFLSQQKRWRTEDVGRIAPAKRRKNEASHADDGDIHLYTFRLQYVINPYQIMCLYCERHVHHCGSGCDSRQSRQLVSNSALDCSQ